MSSAPRFNRRQPVRAIRAMGRLLRDPNATEHVFEIIESLEGRALLNVLERFRATPVGQRVIEEGESMLELLADRDRLSAMPEGSLGRAYLDFIDSEGITAEGLVEASMARDTSPHTDIQRMRHWMRDTHDLWHTLLGYKGDIHGEYTLLAFYVAHVKNPTHTNIGVAFIALGGVIQATRFGYGETARRLVSHAIRRALRGEWLIGFDWFSALERPVDELREELGFGPPPAYEALRVMPGTTSEWDERPGAQQAA